MTAGPIGQRLAIARREMLARLPPPAKGSTEAGMRAAKARLFRADVIFAAYGVLPHPNRPVAIMRGQIGSPDLEGRVIMPARVRNFVRECRYCNEATILLASNGGDTKAAAEIVEALQPIRDRLTVRAIGRCDSAAVDILVQGRHREADASASFMLHRGAWEPTGRWTAARHRAAAAELDHDDAYAAAMYARQTGQPVARIARMMEAETRIFVTEAKRIGLIHEVIR